MYRENLHLTEGNAHFSWKRLILTGIFKGLMLGGCWAVILTALLVLAAPFGASPARIRAGSGVVVKGSVLIQHPLVFPQISLLNILHFS